MRDLVGVFLAVLLAGGALVVAAERTVEWTRSRAAATGGAAMAAFVAASRDYLEAEFATLAGSVKSVGSLTHVKPAALKAAGLLPSAWEDASWGGQRHTLAVRCERVVSGECQTLTALAYTHGGRALAEDAMIVAARSGPVGLGFMTAEYDGAPAGEKNLAVSASGDWEVSRADYTATGQAALANGHMAALLFAHRGRALGPWLCRSEVPARPECNEMTAALKIDPPDDYEFQESSTAGTDDAAALEVVFVNEDKNGKLVGRAVAVTGAARFALGSGRELPSGVAAALEVDYTGGMAVDVTGAAKVSLETGAALPTGAPAAFEVAYPDDLAFQATGAAKVAPGAALASGATAAFEVDHERSGETAVSVSGDSAFGGWVKVEPGTGYTLPTGAEAALEVSHTDDRAVAVDGAMAVSLDSATALPSGAAAALEVEYTAANSLAVEVTGDSKMSGDLEVTETVQAKVYERKSDPRLKADLRALPCTPDMRARLARIPLRTWTWKDGGGRGVGYSAEDVEREFPDLVGRDARGVRHVDYTVLTILRAECARATARAAPACPAGRYGLERWPGASVVVAAARQGDVREMRVPGGPRECRVARAECAGGAWRFGCAPAAGLAFWPEAADRIGEDRG